MTRSEAALRRDADFEQIEAAVMETARGRWFLAEFARRHRSADTVAVLAGLSKLEAVVRRASASKQAPPPRAPSEDTAALRREMATALRHVRDAETRLRASIAGLDPMSAERAQLRVALTLHEAASAKLSAALGSEVRPAKARPGNSPAPTVRRDTQSAPQPQRDGFFEPSALLSRLSGLAPLSSSVRGPATEAVTEVTPPPAVAIPRAVSEQLDAVLSQLVRPEASPEHPIPLAGAEGPDAEAGRAAKPETEALAAERPAPSAKAESASAAPPLPLTPPSVATRSTAALRAAAAVMLDRDAANRPMAGETRTPPGRTEDVAKAATETVSVTARPALALRAAATVLFDRNVTEPAIPDDPTASMSRAEKTALFS